MMIGTMLLGYAVGAIGVYGLLYRFAPMGREDAATHADAKPEIIELPKKDDLRKAA